MHIRIAVTTIIMTNVRSASASTNTCSSSKTSSSDDVVSMIRQLSQEEIEIAARTNYEYAQNPQQENTLQYAMQMADRYLKSKSCKEKALKKMKATIEFRKKMRIDSLRDAVSDQTAEDHLPLTKFLSKKNLYVSGYDNEGRSTYVFVPRLCDDHESELQAHLWTLERALACSKAPDRTLNAVIDFAGFSSTKHAPPLRLGQEVMTTLRDHYIGCVHRIFIVNAPASFSYLWSILKPFAGKTTRDRIQFVSSRRQQQEMIGRWYSKDQVAAWMLPDGEKNRLLDTEEYLYQTPFHRAFDE